jgi:CMP-N,N'-diacetyllegionaminic acid synthase
LENKIVKRHDSLQNFSETIAFIPARGGSKGIKNKNLRLLCGKPLIQHTIDICRKMGLFTFVSTDAREILHISQQSGIEYNYLRPERIAQDDSIIIDAVFDGLEWLNKEYSLSFKYVLLMQPTSPIRFRSDLEKLLSTFENNKSRNSLMSVVKMQEHPLECLKIESDGWHYLESQSKAHTGRQSYNNDYYFVDGAYYMASVDFLKKYNKFVVEGVTYPFVTNNKFSIDIDEEEDLLIAELLLKNLISKS